MIALIPVPAIIRRAQQPVTDQRITAIDAQILFKVGPHNGQRGRVRIVRLAQVMVLRFVEATGLIDPLPGFAVVFAKAQA